jgi:hypothetical protein
MSGKKSESVFAMLKPAFRGRGRILWCLRMAVFFRIGFERLELPRGVLAQQITKEVNYVGYGDCIL